MTKTIPGAKLVKGEWQDMDGKPLTNVELLKLRRAAEREQKKVEREQKKVETPS